jgi:simple sugar transport system ATP-binding protein
VSGVAILYISHRMSDIRRLADSIVSMRDGIISGIFDRPELDYEGAVNAMLGRKIHDQLSATGTSAKVAPRSFAQRNYSSRAGTRPFS